MKKILIFLSLFLGAGTLLAQFTPPSPAVSSVSVDSNNKLVAPTATHFFSKNAQVLSAGTGISGNGYNATAATTWNINTTWLLSWLNSLKRNFYVFADMSPTPLDYNSYLQTTSTQTNVFYYQWVSGVRKETRTANISDFSISLSNATNVVRTSSGTIPTTYNSAQFQNSNITANVNGTISYQDTVFNQGIVQTVTNHGGQLPTYTIKDNVMNLKYWTDCELKVIDKWGNIIYFTSTINLNNAQVASLHPEITDESPTIWYFGTYRYATSECYGLKTQFTDFNSSIGATIGSSYTVSGVWIYPNLSSKETRQVPNYTGYNQQSGTKQVVWGQYIREIFENPNNTIIIWRQTAAQGELFNGKKLWRPVQITHYGNYSTN